MVKGQMKIQQMAFMIVALFLFFILVGLFLIRFSFSNLEDSAYEKRVEKAISALKLISSMPELSCGKREEFCIDEDKLSILILNKEYVDFLPISSVKVRKIYPKSKKFIKCPANNCNLYEIFLRNQSDSLEYSTFVNLCKKQSQKNYAYDECSLAKISLGVTTR